MEYEQANIFNKSVNRYGSGEFYEKNRYSHFYCYVIHPCFNVDCFGYDVYAVFRVRSGLWKKIKTYFGSFAL